MQSHGGFRADLDRPIQSSNEPIDNKPRTDSESSQSGSHDSISVQFSLTFVARSLKVLPKLPELPARPVLCCTIGAESRAAV